MHTSPFGLTLVVWLALTSLARADELNQLTPQELADGWVLLFDGQTMFGWESTNKKINWKVADGVISATKGDKGFLQTTSQFGDYVLKVDFRYPAETNSGVYMRMKELPPKPDVDCYELNIADQPTHDFPTGSLVKRKKAEGVADVREWRSFEVTAQGAHFVIKLDGKTVLDYTDPKTPIGRGFIGLQYNLNPVEFRNVKLKPLGLKSLFNGKDLAGWKAYPDKASVFSVTSEGALNVKGGPGALETSDKFGDFVLQTEVFAGGKNLNSGIFFRCIPGEFTQGYECQIQNAFHSGDRTQPQDYGTGGFYRRQSARKVVSNDQEWFPLTLIVSDNHMAAWVNGYQVSDWTDNREANENPRQGSRLKAGTLALQGHEAESDFSFRKLQAGELPPR